MIFQAKKDQAIPARAGDRAGDRGQRFVWSPLVFEIIISHGHAVLDPLPFANEPRARDRSILCYAPPAPIEISAVEVLGNCLKPLYRLGLEPTVGEFLDSICEAALEGGYRAEAPLRRARATAVSSRCFELFSAQLP
jgi:hypothetical protein